MAKSNLFRDRKCQKTEENSTFPIDSLNDDCLFCILSHLSPDDLNLIAISNRRFCDLRSNNKRSKFRPRFARRMSSQHPNHANQYMFCRCPSIERLSIKECKVSNPTPSGMQSRLLPQALLIKMIRNHPSLHWLRSDLSAEHVAMLQQEHPDTTFVSEYVGL
jgi:hypothetical protein